MTAPIERSEFVGLPEVAERLGVHRATVNDMVRGGRLRAVRDGAHWLVSRADLEDFASTYVRPANAPMRRDRSLPTSTSSVLSLLNEFGSASALELAPLLGLHEGNVRKHLRLIEAAGLIVSGRDGQWRVVDSGVDVVGQVHPCPTTSVA